MSSYIIEKDKLKGEYSKAFDRVEGYTMVRAIDDDTMEEMLMNLVDILYTAQNDNKPVEKIIGKDIDKFCDEYFSNCSSVTKWLKSVPNCIYCMAVCFFVFSLLDIVFPEEDIPLMNAAIDAFPFIGGMISGLTFVLIYMFFGKFIWKKYKNISSNLLSGIYIAGFIVSVVVIICLNSELEIMIPLIPTAIISGVIMVIYKSIELYNRYQKYGSLKKPQKDGSMKDIFIESFSEETGSDYSVELKKQYIKKNKSLAKRGKPQMSPEEYMDYLKDNNKKLERNMYFLLPVYVIIFAVAVYGVAIDNSWDDINTIIFTLILAVLLGALYMLFFKIDKMMVKKNKALLDKCDSEGITVIELADRVEGEEEIEETEEENEIK